MNSKKVVTFVDNFSRCNIEEMDKILGILGRTRETKRIDDAIQHFDSARLEGKAEIVAIECHSIGNDDLGTYEDYNIRLRFNEDRADTQE